jgi:gluconate kinase
MAKRNYLVEGLSGAGKSSVYEELIRRGYKAISTDRAWKYHADPDTGLPGQPIHYDNSMWDQQKAVSELESPEPEVLFVCGSSRNRDRFLPYFTKIFNLRIDDDTMRRRLQERTNNEFGKQPEEVELMLRLNRSDEKPAGAIDVDATQPLGQVVDELLRLANCRAATSATLTPWSKRGSAIGQSFVISESALPIVQAAACPQKRIIRGTSDEFWDALGRETITRIEYAWSGYVLATLLPYLNEQGIDLMHSDHDEVASTISQTRAGSVFVLTSDHRERYLARLDPIEFDGAVLRRYYEEFNETASEGVDYAMLDGIAFFRDTLAPLESAIVAVFIIG